ncbi:MAG: HK97 gp10 family phage protein [Undibacterium sp.]
MKIKINVRGDKNLIAQLKNDTAIVLDASSKFMKRAAERIAKEAAMNAPVDLHNLEKSIHVVKSIGENSRRLAIRVIAGGVVNGVNVDEYATKVHENYDDENPGPGTASKRAANPGRHIGSKFLENAVKSEREGIEQRALLAVVEELKK